MQRMSEDGNYRRRNELVRIGVNMIVTNTCALVIREFPDELEIISELEDKRCLKGLMSLP